MLSVREHADGITVETAGWSLQHTRQYGGAWSVLSDASGSNVLHSPATAALAIKTAQGGVIAYSERNESAPVLRIEKQSEQSVTIVAEGALRDESCVALPVGYRRRTEYRPHGLIWTTIEFMSDCGCGGIVELCALNMAFTSRFQRLLARLHPTQAGLPELFGAHGWFQCAPGTVHFQSRYAPLQLAFSDGARAFEILLPSELSAWDLALKAEAGLGQYALHDDAAQQARVLTLSPYAVYGCAPASFKGTLSFRHAFVLPSGRPKQGVPPVPISAASTLEQLKEYAAKHPALALMNPHPGDPSLPKLIEAAKAMGVKVCAGFSLNELEAEDACFPRVNEWHHMAAPALGPIARRERGDGSPAGAMLCLKSAWFDELQRRIDTVWSAANWDGLQLTDAAFHPCRHPAHGGGPFHSDVEGYLAIFEFCRARIGNSVLSVDHTNGNAPTVYSVNVCDSMLVDAEAEGF